jgi:hypothetical protein
MGGENRLRVGARGQFALYRGIVGAFPEGVATARGMTNQGHPKRKQAPRTGAARTAERSSDSTSGVATRGALDVASYVSDMTAQLETMAQSANLELLSYFLGMARSEADLFIRTNSGPSDSAEEGAAEDDSLSDDGQAEFDSGE